MFRQYELVERVKGYDPVADEDALNRAYVFTLKAHGSQIRASGDPYYSHPVEVAGILAELKLDCDSIITGLLHDTVEDTVATLDEIEGLFGKRVARLVDGVTKLSSIELQSAKTEQAENLRKLVLAMSEDIRVLLVKLADRLHNMRTLHHLADPEKRARIARETLEIYTPLAERIGIATWKDELQDLAFRELYPDIRKSIQNRLEYLRDTGGDLVGRVVDELKSTLAESGLDATVSGREKRPFSIWRKMQRKHMEFEQLSDIVAFRIIVDDLAQCYQALGIIHGRYRMIPDRFKDFISTPKLNDYRSIHTTVIGPENLRIEIQIRTQEMHEVGEYGVAAHWQYKQGSNLDGRQYRWLREMMEILEQAAGPEEFLEHTKLEMFRDQVFCFTPKGDLIALPSGATPVDFAYAVHSEVGDACAGAKINGRLMPLRTTLKNGDQVEIRTSRNQTPSPTWLGFVTTGKARARIRRFIRTQQREQYLSLGRQILQRTFHNGGHEFTGKVSKGVLKRFNCQNVDDLSVLVGQGQHTGREVFAAAFPGEQRRRHARKGVSLAQARGRLGKGKSAAIPIKGLIPGMALHFAGCCHPIPGDRIIGLVTTGKGVTIHTTDCEALEKFADVPERWLDVSWDETADGGPQVGRIQVVIANVPGSLGNLSTVIGKNEGNITNLKITNRSSEFFEMLIDIEVADVKRLTNIIAALRATRMITSVERARG
ncbi:MAG: RelA/SpoT family protein [Kiloniellales bacterium]